MKIIFILVTEELVEKFGINDSDDRQNGPAYCQCLTAAVIRILTPITFDEKSLYTNIEHGLGKTAIHHYMNKYPDLLPKRINKNLITEALDVILKNNTFMFNDTMFIQTSGTAMRTRMAPHICQLNFRIPRI